MPEVISPQPHQVVQRDGANQGSIPIEVRGAPAGATVVLVDAAGASVPCQPKLTEEGARLTGSVDGVPTGGPYALQLLSGDDEVARVEGLLVGDLWILAGQSNMDGCGKLSGAEPPSELVSAFYYDDRWGIAEDPLCWYNEATDPVHWGVLENRQAAIEWDRSMRTIGAGLGIAFGKELVRRLGVPIGLLACSHGGTSMAQWDPALLDRGGESLYGSMIRRVRAAGGRVAGMTWYQGESDANPDAGPVYGEAFTSFVNALRAELGQPEMPVLYVQLGRFYADPTPESERWWHEIREAQRRVEPDIQPAAMVAASDLSLDDIIHVDAPGMRRLGIRMARLAHVVAYGAAEEGWLGPRPTTVDVAEDRQGVTIRFESVNGRLIGTKRLYGFMVRSAEGPLLLGDCRLGGDGLSVELTFPAALPEGAELFYNYGHNPQGVILDGWDMPVPSFGPIAL